MRISAYFIIFIIFLTACVPATSSPTFTPIYTLAPSQTPSLTSTYTITSVPSITPKSTPTSTLIPIPHPYQSPNESLVWDSRPGSNWYIFIKDYDDVDPTWSPDGEHIAFASNRDGNADIYTIDIDGGNLTNLTPDPSPVLASLLFLIDRSYNVWPDWSPGGDQIIFSSSRTNMMMRSTPMDVFVMRSDGTGLQQITKTFDMEGFPDWSPDGQRVIFVSDRDEGNQLYEMTFDGSEANRITDVGMDNDLPSWSPDGRQIAFESNRDGDYDVYVISFPGGDVIQLTNDPGMDSQPSWSPDGRRLAFVSERDGDLEIFLMDSDGENVEQLTSNSIPDYSPDWSPQGDRIAFSSKTSEGDRIFLLNVDGSNLVQLTGEAGKIPPTENAVYHLHRGLALHYSLMRTTEGNFDDIIAAYSTAITLDPRLAEAYLARGMATLFNCEIFWMHVLGSELSMVKWNDNCPSLDDAIEDIQKALHLGLAPAITPGVRNLLELL